MKERLDKASKEALIAYRLQRAHDTLSEARLLMDASFFNAATNRLYYACYYASVALLLKHDLQSQSHKGAKALLGLHFVSTGLLPVKVGKVITKKPKPVKPKKSAADVMAEKTLIAVITTSLMAYGCRDFEIKSIKKL